MSFSRRIRWSVLAIALSLGLVAASCARNVTTDPANSGTAQAPGSDGPATTKSTSQPTSGNDPTQTTPGPATSSEQTATSEPSTTATSSDATTAPAPDSSDVAPPVERDFTAVTEAVNEFVVARGLDGAGLIIVHEDDGVVYEDYFGTFSPDRISLIASTSKMISAGVVMRLHEDGVLDVNAPIDGVVDWAAGNPDLTPAQLISNSSGLVGLRPDPRYAPYLCQWTASDTLQSCGQTVFNSAADDADQAPPDTEFRYGGAQWQVAGAVAESTSGKTWNQLIDEIYVEPCGVDSLGYISLGALATTHRGYPDGFGGAPSSVTPSSNPSIGGGAHITVGDYGKLLLMHLRGGRCGDDQVLSQASLDTMHSDRIGDVYDGNTDSRNTGYGMGWWINRNTGRLTDPGIWGSISWLDLEGRYGAYLVIEDKAGPGEALQRQIESLVDEAVTGG